MLHFLPVLQYRWDAQMKEFVLEDQANDFDRSFRVIGQLVDVDRSGFIRVSNARQRPSGYEIDVNRVLLPT